MVLGLSLTPTAVGWVLVDRRDADGAILDYDDFEVRFGGGLAAANTAASATEAVLRARQAAAEREQVIRLIALTWSDDAAAEAALLTESLADAGFDNVVPIRWLRAAELLAEGMAPVVGHEKVAVCLLDGEPATIVMVDDGDSGPHTAVKQVHGGAGRQLDWLTEMFDKSSWLPTAVVAVGAGDDLDALTWQLESALPAKVFTQAGMQSVLARGAALASARCAGFPDRDVVDSLDAPRPDPARARSRSFAGAMTMLVAGAVTFVASLSLALGPRLVPERPPVPARQVVHTAVAPPAVPNPHPMLVRVLERMRGHVDGAAPEPAPSPDDEAPAP